MDLSIQSGTGDDVPPNPFVYRVLDAARPGKSIRGLQHPQLGEVLVNLENPSYKIQVASRPWKQMSESSSDDLIGVKLSFHKKTLKFKKQILKAGIGQGTPAIQIAGKPATIKKSQC